MKNLDRSGEGLSSIGRFGVLSVALWKRNDSMREKKARTRVFETWARKYREGRYSGRRPKEREREREGLRSH